MQCGDFSDPNIFVLMSDHDPRHGARRFSLTST
jgi:hypothetical protein